MNIDGRNTAIPLRKNIAPRKSSPLKPSPEKQTTRKRNQMKRNPSGSIEAIKHTKKPNTRDSPNEYQDNEGDEIDTNTNSFWDEMERVELETAHREMLITINENATSSDSPLTLGELVHNFSDLFHAALADTESAKTFQNVMEPLLETQTRSIQHDMEQLRTVIENQEQRITSLESKITVLEEGNSQLKEDNMVLKRMTSEDLKAQNSKIDQSHSDSLMQQKTSHNQQCDIASLIKATQQQQRTIENMDIEMRKNNLIMTGIPEASNSPEDELTEKAKSILTAIGIQETVIKETNITRINPVTQQTAVMKLTFDRRDNKQSVQINARKLKESQQHSKIYIKADRTPLASKEDYRLRQKKRQLREEYPTSTITIYKGVLAKDGLKMDEFDISNQIFRN